MLEKNLNTRGRIIRLAFAIGLFAFAWWQSSWIALVFGFFCLFEALASWCVLYQLLGINQCKIHK